MDLKRAWYGCFNKYIGGEGYYYLLPTLASLLPLKDVLPRFCRDKNVLDVGAGAMTHRYLVKPVAKNYITLDKFKEHPDLDVVADAAEMPFPDAKFDVVISIQVLEHVPNPEKVFSEIARVLIPGGHAIITVPHLSFVHGEPHDYFRYTKYGLAELGRRAGLVAEEVRPLGGVLSFVLTPFSMAVLTLTDQIPILNKIVYQINKYWSLLLLALDSLIDCRGVGALHYLAIYKKPDNH